MSRNARRHVKLHDGMKVFVKTMRKSGIVICSYGKKWLVETSEEIGLYDRGELVKLNETKKAHRERLSSSNKQFQSDRQKLRELARRWDSARRLI